VLSERSNRHTGAITEGLQRMWRQIAGALNTQHAAFVSGASGAEPATGEERAFLSDHSELAVRATGTHIGHGPEPQFAMNIAIAALALSKGHLFSACDGTGFERAMQQPLAQVVVTGVGHWRGEGLGVVEAIH
jgi:3-oxoacyl-[acyl-carrier-protein] synthase II